MLYFSHHSKTVAFTGENAKGLIPTEAVYKDVRSHGDVAQCGQREEFFRTVPLLLGTREGVAALTEACAHYVLLKAVPLFITRPMTLV